MLGVFLRAVFGGDISSETARILNVYACPLVDDLQVALHRPPNNASFTCITTTKQALQGKVSA
jgi:hypothetical protein